MVYEPVEPIEAKAALISDPMFPGNAVIDILRETGIGIEFISDAEDIFFKLKRGNIGLILIDIVTINPPILDLIERLQSYVQEMPVIVMSAESTYRQLRPVLRFKEFYYLNKPYQNDEFLILVRRLLSTWALKAASIKMKERSQLRERELEMYAQAGRLLASRIPIEEKLTSLFGRVSSLVPSECWNIIFLDPKTGEMVFRIVNGEASHSPATRESAGRGILGWVARHKTAAIIENVKKDKRCDPALDEAPGIKARSMLCIPLVFADDLMGILQLINRAAETAYSEADVENITPFADYAALAVAHAQAAAHIEELSVRDPLTGLFNTKHLDAMMDIEIKRSSRYEAPLTFMMIDVDGYYDLCERAGREIGTELVKDISKLLRAHVRDIDILARYTADRFGALLPSLSSPQGFIMAERLRQEIAEHVFPSTGELIDKTTVSIGLASYPRDAASKNDLMALAHKALDVAKKEGKNRVVTAESIANAEKPKRRAKAKV
ncbi:MAG: diguanylate cyclase [Candidatus Coatesbacteria bacterium]|nr:diguanylate cyclase [Candidatus Coatesbacteria bacterium]